MKRTAVVIINTYSRRGEKLFFTALDALQNSGISVIASYPVRRLDKLPEIIEEALARRSDLVIAGGGDGTISSIADHLAHRNITLGLLPLGTGNSFIRSLGIPLTLPGAIEVILHGKAVKTDLGKVNGGYFANVASIGFAADVARSTPRRLKRLFGPLAYGLVGVKHFFMTRKFHAEITVDGKKHSIRTHNIIIANGNVYGISRLVDDADVDSGRLLVLTMDMMSRWQHLRFWLHILSGSRKKLSGVQYFLASHMTIKTNPVRHIDIDGDCLATTPAAISAVPAALTVMVPMSFHEHEA